MPGRAQGFVGYTDYSTDSNLREEVHEVMESRDGEEVQLVEVMGNGGEDLELA